MSHKYLNHTVIVLDQDWRYFAILYYGETHWVIYDRLTGSYSTKYKDRNTMFAAFELLGEA